MLLFISALIGAQVHRPPDRSPVSATRDSSARDRYVDDSADTAVIWRVSYSISIYGNGSALALNNARLMQVFNFATCVMTGIDKFDHVSLARMTWARTQLARSVACRRQLTHIIRLCAVSLRIFDN